MWLLVMASLSRKAPSETPHDPQPPATGCARFNPVDPAPMPEGPPFKLPPLPDSDEVIDHPTSGR